MSHLSPIIVTVSAETVDEIRSKLVQLAKEFGYDDRQGTLPLTPPVPTGVAADTTAAPEKRGRGRPPSAEKAPSAPEKQSATSVGEKGTESTSSAPATPTPATTPVSVTKDNVVAALQQLQTAVNLKAVIEVLGKFSAKKASEVKPEDYLAVVTECNRRVSESATLTA